MPDSDRLLVISHPVLAAIGRREIEEAIPRRQRAGGYDHVEITPLRAELGRLHETDWATALAEQERQFAQRLQPELVGRQRIAYFGFAPIPLALHLGYRVERGVKVDVYQRHHVREDWVWVPDDQAARRSLMKPLNLPEHGSLEAGPVVIRVSTSHRIVPAETEEVVPRRLAAVDVSLKDPSEDALETRGDLAEVVRSFNQAISQLKKLFPNLTEIHLFAAIPVVLAFRLGTQINPSIYGQTVTYQYWAKRSPRYRAAIILDTPSFLDDAEYDWSKPEAVEFYELMSRAYEEPADAEQILAKSGVDKASIDFRQPTRDFWKQALEVAALAGRNRRIAQSARNDPGIAEYHPKLDRLMGPSPAPVEAPAPIQEPVQWNGDELITGKQATFLEMSFFHLGLHTAASVVRLTTSDQSDQSFHGTGFLIAQDTILTNCHVLHDKNGRPVKQVEIWFNFERDAAGRPRTVDSYEGDVSTIVGEVKHDWAIIRSKKPISSHYPILDLRPSRPVQKGDFVYIVQHPSGELKKVGLVHNEVVHVSDNRIQYLTDTLPGSSGSPVCNEHWEVVALHRCGIENDRTEGSTSKNEGIPIQRIVKALTARGILKLVP